MQRRDFVLGAGAFAGLGAFGLSGCAARRVASAASPALPSYDAVAPIPLIRAHADRIFRTTVCLRPFRATGPRIEAERVGDKLVVHNYGHGGSGWSLSWGSAAEIVKLVMTGGAQTDVAVIGCGALGLTAATMLQREGVRVTIYARERPPFVRSSRATGSWTPDSRVALEGSADTAFAERWERMARASFAMYQGYLGLAGDPIEWTDRYELGEVRERRRAAGSASAEPGARHEFVHLNARIADLTPQAQLLPAGSTPFRAPYVWRNTSLTFNVASYAHLLVNDFLVAGGRIETREFHTPGELASLAQPVVVNCTGYGARTLWSDESIVPVRGQIAWLIPQEGVHYGIYYKGLNVLARRDGIVVQLSANGEETGWNDTNEQPDRAEAEEGVRQLAALYPHAQPA